MAVAAFPLSRLVRNRPEDYGYVPDGAPVTEGNSLDSESEIKSPVAPELDYTWRQAIRTRAFWLISLGHGCAVTALSTVVFHLGPLMIGRDFSLQDVGWVLAMYAAAGAVFSGVGGYLGDRVSIRGALIVFTAIQAGAIVVLILAESLLALLAFAALFGMGYGGRIPVGTAIRGLYFGRKAFASIMGISMIPMNIMMLTGPLFVGITFDLTDSYTISLIATATVNLVGALLFLFLGKPAPPRTASALATSA